MTIRAFNLGLLLTFFSFSIFAQPAVVGKISFAKGSNAAQQPNTAPRLLGKDAEVFEGDNIQTSDSSFVIVEFNDGSKVTIRPNSNFKIEKFDSATKNAKLTVYEGTIRATTGEFAKQGGDNFQIKTPTATLKGAKDSDYSVSACKENCSKDDKDSVAKVVDVTGDVYAKNGADKNATERKLSLGNSLFEKDHLSSQDKSSLIIVFRDNQKVTIQPKTEFDIAEYSYQKPGKSDKILMKLAAGGLRSLTGSIGKKDKSAYALDTPVATIGIRGTDENVECLGTGSCTPDNGVAMQVNSGEGTIKTPDMKEPAVIETGNAAMIKEGSTQLNIPSSELPEDVSKKMDSAKDPNKAPDSDKTFSSGGKDSFKVNKGEGSVSTDKDEDDGGDKESKKEEGAADKKEDSKKDSSEKTLKEGDAATTDESGNASDGVPEEVEQDFSNAVAPNNTQDAAVASSPVNDSGTPTPASCATK